jgi:hypothetical protein
LEYERLKDQNGKDQNEKDFANFNIESTERRLVEYKYNVKMSKTFDYKKIVIMLQ